MTTFKTWTHPRTGAVRIYMNGVIGQSGAKVWAEHYPSEIADIQVKVSAGWAMNAAAVKDAAYDAIEAVIGRSGRFSDLAKLAA